MAELIDYSYARFSPAEVKSLGKVGVIRYVASGRPEVSATKAEVDAFRSAGLAFVAVWQRGKDRALLGREAGVLDARDAAAYCATLGATGSDPIHFSVDIDATPAQLPAVLAYFEGVASVLGWARVGVYGGIRTLTYLHERTPIGLWWQTASWSGGQLAPFATLYQYRVDTPTAPVRLLGRAVDLDRSLKSYYGAWAGARMAEAELYPGARWYPLGAQTENRMTAHDVACAHTMVGYLTSTDPYFRVYNGVGYAGTESHIGIGGKWGPDLGGGLDGATWQWQDFAYRADANLDGNYRVISFETADNAPASPDDIAAWTPAQVEEIVRFLDWICSPAAHAKCPTSWLCHQVGIPRVLIPDSKPGRRGIGYHAQGAAERVAGGEMWSTSPTKPCPAWRRIVQLKTVIVPRVAALGSGQEDTLSAEDVKAINDHTDAMYRLLARGELDGKLSPNHYPNSIAGLRAVVVGQADALTAVRAALDAVRADQSVSGELEVRQLEALGRLEAELAEHAAPQPTPEPTP